MYRTTTCYLYTLQDKNVSTKNVLSKWFRLIPVLLGWMNNLRNWMARSVWRTFSLSSQPSSSAMMVTILGSASSAAYK